MPGPDRRRLRSHRCGSAAPARTPCAGRVTKPWQVSWLAGHRRSFAFPVHLDARTSGVPKDGSPLTVAGAAAESAQEPHRVPFSSGHESSPAARNQSALTVAEEIVRVNPPRTSQGRILPRHCASRFPNGGATTTTRSGASPDRASNRLKTILRCSQGNGSDHQPPADMCSKGREEVF